MRALVFDAIGGPEVVQVRSIEPPPPPGPREVRLRVRAAGLNFADTLFVRGRYFAKPRLPDVPGLEAAGEVEAVGAEVTTCRPGDRVMAIGARAFAEAMLVPEAAVYPMPAALGFEQAAALPIQGLTAHHTLFLMGRLQPGERVLVHAAGGGVGKLAVQLAKARGAAVVASASAEKHAALRALGADAVVDSRGDVALQIKGQVGDVDVVLEMVGGTESYKRNFACLRPFGRMIVYGAASGDTRGTFEPVGLMGKNLTISGYYLTPLVARRELCAPPLAELASLVVDETLSLDVSTFALEDARAAFERLEGRASTGKLVLVP
jgi:NADPH2:quinone reductase